MRASIFRLLKSPTFWRVIPALLLVEIVAVLAFYAVERTRLRAVEKEVSLSRTSILNRFASLLAGG